MAVPNVFDFDFELTGTESNSFVPLDSYIETLSGTNHLVVGANDYFNLHPKQSLWAGLTDEEKQQFLVRSTSRLNVEEFGGRKGSDNQRLQFPRSWLVDRNYDKDIENHTYTGSHYFQNQYYLPMEMENATFELALYYIEEWNEESELVSRRDQERLESFSIGPLSAKTRKWKEDKLPDLVRRLLTAIGPDGWQGNRQARLVR